MKIIYSVTLRVNFLDVILIVWIPFIVSHYAYFLFCFTYVFVAAVYL